MNIQYSNGAAVSAEAFVDLLKRSGLAARRPVDDRECIAGMIANSNLVASAWQGDRLMGIARSLTDFHYVCYLSDLAVDAALQRGGIGRGLIGQLRIKLGPHCKIVLLAEPGVESFYEHLGFERSERCYLLPCSIKH